MGENSKQVRVDNWGIFFLQRLQSFFNKTDYCDLTLQFNGNVQLKVHRLVLNACTEYFQILEQTCEMLDDNIIIMPQDLQSDVVLPIVNFMYTGMLEFQMGNYDKLYKTAELMNITVLTKLLDAQKVPPSPLHKPMNRKAPPPVTWNLQGKKIMAKTMDPDLPEPLPGRKLPIWKRKSAPYMSELPRITKIIPPFQDPLTLPKIFTPVDNTPKPTRFELPEEVDDDNTFDSSSFDEISYTSRPLAMPIKSERKYDSFEEIKRTAKTIKRSLPSQTAQKPARPLDLEEVKDFIREQKLRSELIDYDDSEAADGDLEPYGSDSSSQTSQKNKSPVHVKRVKFSDEKENSSTQPKISGGGSTSSDVNHTKIITEVLKKYPHLVKKNKNIRLKILAKSSTAPMTKVSSPVKVTTSTSKVNLTVSKQDQGKQKIRIGNTEQLGKKVEEGPWICHQCSAAGENAEFVLYYLYRKHMTEVHNEKMDSRMCKFCGHKSTKHNLLMYHQYVAHGVKPPVMYNFPKCNQCNYIALTEALLIKHKLSHKNFGSQCSECKIAFNNQEFLADHMVATGHMEHPFRNNYDCQYCAKKYQNRANLFSHIKLHHKEEARRDGIASVDDENHEEEDGKYPAQQVEESSPSSKDKVTILSNVKVNSADMGANFLKDNPNQKFVLPEMTGTELTNLEPSSEAEAFSNVASGIATSLGLVDTIVVLDDNQFILRSNNEQNQAEYILPELDHHSTAEAYMQNLPNAEDGSGQTNKELAQSLLSNNSISSTDELVMVLTDHDYGDGTNNEMLNSDNSNIVVLYSHPVDGQDTQFITTQQGNLILNPDTGMIEVAGNFGQSNATADNSVECLSHADHTDISLQQHQKPVCEESIEMIQQEIKNMDQGANINNKALEQTDSALISQQASIDNQTEVQQEENVVYEDATDVTDGQQGVKQGDEAPVEFVEEPMEVDEECSADVLPEHTELQTSEVQEVNGEGSYDIGPETTNGQAISDEQHQGDIPAAPAETTTEQDIIETTIHRQQQQHSEVLCLEETVKAEDEANNPEVKSEDAEDVKPEHDLQEVEPMEVDSGVGIVETGICVQGEEVEDKMNIICDSKIESVDEVDSEFNLQEQPEDNDQMQQQQEQPLEEEGAKTEEEEEFVEEEEEETAVEDCQDSQGNSCDGAVDGSAACLMEAPACDAAVAEPPSEHLDDTSLSQDISENEGSAPESASQESATEFAADCVAVADAVRETMSVSPASSKAPKISNIILEDWEDTDNSQQSDRGIPDSGVSIADHHMKEASKAQGVSINTLINDWEEDDDDVEDKIDKNLD